MDQAASEIDGIDPDVYRKRWWTLAVLCSSLSVNGTDGKKHTYTCNDGKWTETVSIVAQPPRWTAIASVSSAGITFAR